MSSPQQGRRAEPRPGPVEADLAQRTARPCSANGTGAARGPIAVLDTLAGPGRRTKRAILALDLDRPAPDGHAEARKPGRPDQPSAPLPGHARNSCARAPPSTGRTPAPGLTALSTFSRMWSPRGYDGFHEACGLFVLATIAARRVALAFGKRRYTPLYVLLCSRSSLYAKSTTAEIALDVLRPPSSTSCSRPTTPRPALHPRSVAYVPPDYSDCPRRSRRGCFRRLAFAGQRGWYAEEFGQHLDAMMREGGTISEFRGILRRLTTARRGTSTPCSAAAAT